MSNIYSRPITTDLNHMGNIITAYRQAGLTAPSLGAEIQHKIDSAPTARQVANTLAQEALQAGDVDVWHADALEQIRQAQAADALRKEFSEVFPYVVRAAMPDYLEQATLDLKAPFDKLVKTFTQAVGKLPSGAAALDAEAVVVADAGAALNTVRESLARFNAYAGIFRSLNGNSDYPSDLNALLPLVELPTPVVEQVRGVGNEVANEPQLVQTRAIRKLAADIRRIGADLVLIGIARGEYGKAALSLATPSTLVERVAKAGRAHARERVAL